MSQFESFSNISSIYQESVAQRNVPRVSATKPFDVPPKKINKINTDDLYSRYSHKYHLLKKQDISNLWEAKPASHTTNESNEQKNATETTPLLSRSKSFMERSNPSVNGANASGLLLVSNLGQQQDKTVGSAEKITLLGPSNNKSPATSTARTARTTRTARAVAVTTLQDQQTTHTSQQPQAQERGNNNT
ncbi:hypothetical protein RFI_01477, partial [Reticulomyxa filosa]